MALRGLVVLRNKGLIGAACRALAVGGSPRSSTAVRNKACNLLQVTEKCVAKRISANYCAAAPDVQNSFCDGSKEQLDLDPQGRTVTVTWKDGSKSRFHSKWLRHSCQCTACRQEHSGQSLLDPALPLHANIEHVRVNGEQLEVVWGGGEGEHRGHVPLSYLYKHSYEAESLRDKREAAKLGPPAQALPELHYSDMVKNSEGVLRWMRQLNEAGVSLLKGVPTEDSMVQKVAEHIGPVEDLMYGATFDVVSTPKPINVAYMSVGLDFHTDLIYYESAPGLQLLHALRFDECVEGGESRFLDVFHVAEQFRKEHPDMFHTLTRVPATFQKIHYDRDYPVDMIYQRPHIMLNQYQEIVAVNWAPPSEGPLAVQQDDVDPYFEAHNAFAKAIKFSPNILEYRLKAGDLVTFNNRRVLHARNSFDLNGGVRHLKGCYVSSDHFKSQMRVFSNLYGSGQPVKRVGNQDWF